MKKKTIKNNNIEQVRMNLMNNCFLSFIGMFSFAGKQFPCIRRYMKKKSMFSFILPLLYSYTIIITKTMVNII